MKRVQVSITERQWEKLDDLRRNSGMGLSEHVRRALDLYLGKWRVSENKRESVRVTPEFMRLLTGNFDSMMKDNLEMLSDFKEMREELSHATDSDVGVGGYLPDVVMGVCERSQPSPGECSGADDD
jgi:hypothetical protein